MKGEGLETQATTVEEKRTTWGVDLSLENIPKGSLRATHGAGFWCILYKWGAASRATLVSRNLCKIIPLGTRKDLQCHLAQPCLESSTEDLCVIKMRIC